jgi:hypothetical protein
VTLVVDEPRVGPGSEAEPGDPAAGAIADPPAAVWRAAIAGALAAAAAGWIAAGMFRGSLPRVTGVVTPLLGAALAALSNRSRRPALVAHLALVAALVAGGLLALTAGRGSVPRAITDALRGGGLAQPPVAFDAGWRFLLAVTGVVLGSAAAGLPIALGRLRSGLVLPAAVGAACLLVQPRAAEVVSVAGGAVLLAAAFAISYDTRAAGQTATFETRRLVRAGVVVAVIVATLVAVSRVDALFPSGEHHQVVPPRRPPAAPPESDRVLFRVEAAHPQPWRLGVLDGYDGRAWLTPPFDTRRLRPVRRPSPTPPGEPNDERVTITIAGLRGHALPTIAGARSVTGVRAQVDPRTGDLRLPATVARAGVRYVVVAPAAPTAAQLARAGPAPPSMRPFLAAPPPPREIAAVLAHLPQTNAFDRLQQLRSTYYANVVAAGAGNPVDVPPHRVVEIMQGKEASPFELTAGEALLARWAGLPARIGYGWYRGDAVAENGGREGFAVRPRHGSTWLEVWFRGFGWVPIVGTPPRARASLARQPVNPNAAVRPSELLTLSVFVPVRVVGSRSTSALVGWWALHVLGAVGALAFVLALTPAALRRVRRARRARFARRGDRARLALAYAELRECATDLGVGASALTPLEFVAAVAPDDEHRQLAWLVTRALWGDLAPAVDGAAAAHAEAMARSVRRRLRRAQPVSARLAAIVSRASLRDPYSTELPGVAPSRRALAIAALAILGVASSAGVAAAAVWTRPPPVDVRGRAGLPNHLAPAALDDLVLQDEPAAARPFARERASAAAAGRVISVRRAGDVEAALQAVELRPRYDGRDPAVRADVLRAIGGRGFRLGRIGDDRVYLLDQPEQRIMVWFAPSGRVYEVFVARASFEPAPRLFAALLAYQRGEVAPPPPVPIPDPRRGEQ